MSHNYPEPGDLFVNEPPYPFESPLGIMKPNSIDKRKPREVAKLQFILEHPSWIAEEKIDGCHYTSIGHRFFGPRISDVTGYPVEKTRQFQHLSEALKGISNFLILDGEISFPGWKSQDVLKISGCSPREAIIRQAKQDTWLNFVIYDILRDTDGTWLYHLPWQQRRTRLTQLRRTLEAASKHLIINPVVRDSKEKFLEEVLSRGGEGVVLKHVDSKYYFNKRPKWQWMKIKTEIEDDVVVVGYEPPVVEYTGKDYETWPYWGKKVTLEHNENVKCDEVQRLGRKLKVLAGYLISTSGCPDEDWIPVSKNFAMGWIGAIAFGKYKGDKLVRLGTCSGMNEETRQYVTKHQEQLLGRTMTIVAMEIEPSGAYRHPRFKGFHADKNPRECIL